MNLTNPLGSISALIAFLLPIFATVFGCTSDATSDIGAKCSASFLTPGLAMWVAFAFAALVLLAKLMRPGGWLSSLFGTTAVVVPTEKAKPGVVTKEQVEAPK